MATANKAVYTPAEARAIACLSVAREAATERRYYETRLRELRADFARASALSNADGRELRAIALSRLAEAARDLSAAISRYWTVIRFADDCVSRIPDGRFRVILRLRYFAGLSWPRVREEMELYSYYYEDKQIFRMHKAALRALAEEIERAAEAMGIDPEAEQPAQDACQTAHRSGEPGRRVRADI